MSSTVWSTSLLISLRIPRLLATLSCCVRCFVLAWAAVCSCCMWRVLRARRVLAARRAMPIRLMLQMLPPKRARALSPARPTTSVATTPLKTTSRPRSCARPICIPPPRRPTTPSWYRCSRRARPGRSRSKVPRTRRFPCCVRRSLRCWYIASSIAGTLPLRRLRSQMPSATRRAIWAKHSRVCSPGYPLPMASRSAMRCPQAMSFASAMAGSSATTCCATFRPSTPAGLTPVPKRLIPFVRPSTAFSCARCPLNAWRRAPHGCCSRCWSV